MIAVSLVFVIDNGITKLGSEFLLDFDLQD